MLSKSIKINSNGKISEFNITALDRDSTWSVLDTLWQDYVANLRRKLDPTEPEASPNSRISTNMAQVKKDSEKLEFSSYFCVPDYPTLSRTFTCYFWIGKVYVRGTLYITDNFFCYRATDPFYEGHRVVVAWINVGSLSRAGSLWGLVDNAIKMKTNSGNEFSFYVTKNRDELWSLMERTWSDVRRYIKERGLIEEEKRTNPLLGLDGEDWGNIQSDEDSSSCGWTMDREIVDDPDYKKSEEIKRTKWQEYFNNYGCLVEPIIMPEFNRLILQDGIPGLLTSYSDNLFLRFLQRQAMAALQWKFTP